ncbi:MAG: RimK family alpha-L-glutamate ligase [Desulfobacterales bacterium]
MDPNRKVIALAGRLRACRNVTTLGVKTNFADYGPSERALIRQAPKIYYPTPFYAELFDTVGKKTFPSYHTYKCVQDKIKQSALFTLTGIPQPRTRVFYGRRQKSTVGDYFTFPFVAKIPRGSALGRGVFLIHTAEELQRFLARPHPALIQEYVPLVRDIRVVIIGRRIAHAYWRINPAHDFRSNVAVGAQIGLDPVPAAARALALHTAHSCGWDDVGLDICEHEGRFLVLEANMNYGRQGFRAAGIDYIDLMERLIENGDI